MNMKDIIGKKIKISANSITVKDDAGKTRGIVKNIRKFIDCRANLQSEIWRTLKNAKVGWTDIADTTFYVDGKWWYINDLKWESDYFKYFEGRDENMDKQYQKRRNIYDALVNENIMEVIDCWILK